MRMYNTTTGDKVRRFQSYIREMYSDIDDDPR